MFFYPRTDILLPTIGLSIEIHSTFSAWRGGEPWFLIVLMFVTAHTHHDHDTLSASRSRSNTSHTLAQHVYLSSWDGQDNFQDSTWSSLVQRPVQRRDFILELASQWEENLNGGNLGKKATVSKGGVTYMLRI